MKLKFTLVFAFFAITFLAKAQEFEPTGASYVGQSLNKVVVPSLASRSNTLEAAVQLTEAPKDGRSVKVEVIPEKDPQTENDYFSQNQHITAGKYQTRALSNDFVVGNNVGSPSDPAIGVGGLDEVVIVYNTGFMIYDKSGNILQGPTNPNAIFANGGCCDLTVSYDNEVDRWVLTYLFVGAGMQIAVSDGSSAINSSWNVYTLPQVSDYNKLSIYGNAYYVTDNGANDVWAIERQAAIDGEANVGIQGFNVPGLQGQGFTSAQVLHVTNGDHPTTPGAPIVYMRDDGFAGVTMDAINIWTVTPDFTTPANSTVSAPEVFPATPFINVFDGGGFSNLTQPGGGIPIDALQSTIMNQAQFRRFPNGSAAQSTPYNSGIFNFVVDTDAGAGELAGIRWYEFRQPLDGGPWTMAQEGTYTAPDGRHAWNGSMSMDDQANIALGYSTMAGPDTPDPTANRVGAAFTGRSATDADGTMTLDENRFAIANNNVAGLRFGDYAKVSVDPNDDQTFWFITEYTNTNHVAVFRLATDFDNDTGVIALVEPANGDLSATENITVMVRNYGLTEQSNIPVSFTIDGGTTITETIAGPIPPLSNMMYTFTATGDFSVDGTTYSVNACTALVGDEFTANDCITVDVTHLNDIDTGVSVINTPVSGTGLGTAEIVTITIENFGAQTQTDIPVYYTLDGGAQVVEMYTGSIAPGATDTYSFAATIDISELGDYVLCAGTDIMGDTDTDNNETCATVSNFICQPNSGCADFNDGVTVLNLADQNINPSCGTGGYDNDPNTVFNFVLGDNPFDGVLQTGFQNSEYVIWIDFNDNNDFEANEIIAQGISGTVANTNVNFTVNFNTIPTTMIGMHTMRVRGGDVINGSGDVSDPCSDLQFGRTNDYMANVTGVLGIDDQGFGAANLTVTTLPNDQFELNFDTTDYTDRLPVRVYNTQGQNLAYYTLENNGAGYNKTINMSYVASGVYFIQVGNENLNRVKRIIVK